MTNLLAYDPQYALQFTVNNNASAPVFTLVCPRNCTASDLKQIAKRIEEHAVELAANTPVFRHT